MNDGFSWWLVVLGIAVGIGVVWLFTVRLPVNESDADEAETIEEAGWISETIESWGGVAPAPLVQEVLQLHRRYLDGDRSIAAAGGDVPDIPPSELLPPEAPPMGPPPLEIPPPPEPAAPEPAWPRSPEPE
jgi:hypothetical protein